ncbi:MAG: MATE family efflux transporter [Bdellovibrionales bacterium]
MTDQPTPTKPLPYANKGNLTSGPVRGHLVRLTVPMIWGLLAVIAVQLADTYFISLMGDTDVLAGISLTFPITMVISHLVFGINIAMSSNVSRLIGEGKRSDARIIVLHGIIMAFTAAALIALLTYTCLEPLFTLLGADDTTYPVVQQYMPIWLAASVVLSIPVNGNSAIRASGDSLTPAIVMTTAALINFILDPILIFGLFGAPEMGVEGAATATLIAYIGCFALGLYFLIVKKDLLARDSLHLDKFKASMKRLLVIAIPAGIANIIGPGTNAVLFAVLAQYGNEAVAAMGVVSRIEAFALLIVISLALGMSPIIGQNWGAKNFARVHETINLAILFNFIWSFAVAIIFGLFARQIAAEFSNDPAVIEYAALFFWIVPFSYAFGNLVMGWSSAFNAMGMPKKAFVMITVKSLVITLPAIYLGSYLGDVTGIFIALALANLASGLLFHTASRRKCREEETGGTQ